MNCVLVMGVPELLHQKPVNFEIKRLSLDESSLDIPIESSTVPIKSSTVVWHDSRSKVSKIN